MLAPRLYSEAASAALHLARKCAEAQPALQDMGARHHPQPVYTAASQALATARKLHRECLHLAETIADAQGLFDA